MSETWTSEPVWENRFESKQAGLLMTFPKKKQTKNLRMRSYCTWRCQLGKTTRFESFWWWGPTPKNMISAAEFVFVFFFLLLYQGSTTRLNVPDIFLLRSSYMRSNLHFPFARSCLKLAKTMHGENPGRLTSDRTRLPKSFECFSENKGKNNPPLTKEKYEYKTPSKSVLMFHDLSDLLCKDYTVIWSTFRFLFSSSSQSSCSFSAMRVSGEDRLRIHNINPLFPSPGERELAFHWSCKTIWV